MEKLKDIKHKLVDAVYDIVVNGEIASVNASELGEVIDVIKDIEQIKYYSSITDAMEETSEKEMYMKEYLPEYKLAKSRMYFNNDYTMSCDDVIDKLKSMYNDADAEHKLIMKQSVMSLGEQM